jgi:hypothetical protein
MRRPHFVPDFDTGLDKEELSPYSDGWLPE